MSITGPSHLVFSVYDPFSETDAVKEIWSTLLTKCPHNYFQSWTWKELWIQTLPPDCGLYFIGGFIAEVPVVAFFIGSKITKSYEFIRLHQLIINATLNPDFDAIYSEDDTFLIDPDLEISLDFLLEQIPITWDRFKIKTHVPKHTPNLIINETACKDYSFYVFDRKSYYIDLNKVRSRNLDFLTLLNAKKRYQIRHSIKEYEKIGEITFTLADSIDQSLEFFEQLVELHQNRWTMRGQPGIFSNKYVCAFHKNLISRRFTTGEIQLMKISAGEQIIGYRYGFAYNGKIISYISGTSYVPHKSFTPGYISCYYAILYYAERGFYQFEFLEGEDEHKRVMSTDYTDMKDITINKRNIKYLTTRTISKFVQRCRKYINIKN